MGRKPMAAPQLTGAPARTRAATQILLGLWGLTAIATILVATVGPLHTVARDVLTGLGLDLRAREPTMHALLTRLAGNVRIAMLPVLLAATGAARHPSSRAIADAVIAGTLALNATLVGAALAVCGRPLVAFLPHLPLEWAGLACCAAPWLLARRNTPRRGDTLISAAAGVLLLACAALVENLSNPRP